MIELLFATGIRISELCSLKMNDINLYDGTILIYGKGSKERKLQIGNDDVIHILEKYKKNFLTIIQSTNHFFVNQSGNPLSDQAVRRAINKYTSLAAIELHITPHMFRHTFVSILLSNPEIGVATVAAEAGHAQPSTTLAIYTQVYDKRRKEIRNQMSKELYE